MPITRTTTGVVVSQSGSFTVTSTTIATLTITPNPLTTVWEPPSYCTQSFLSNCQTDAVSGTLPCFVSLYPEGVCDSTGQSCYPAAPGLLGNTYLYSPGLACPTGWTTASQGVLSPSGGQDDETTAHCCPLGLQVTTYGTYSTWCEGTITAGDATMIVNGLSQCPSSTTAFAFGPSTPVDLTWVNVDSTKISVSGAAAFTVSAQQVVLLYKSSDVASGGSGLASSTGSGGARSSAATGVGGGGGGGGGGSSGLSTGATAGIAIAAAAVGIGAVLGAFYLYLRHRHGNGVMRGSRKAGVERKPGAAGSTFEGPAPHSREAPAEAAAAAGLSHAPAPPPGSQHQHELKGSDLDSSRRSSPASLAPTAAMAAVMDMGQGTARPAYDHAWSAEGLPPHAMGDEYRQAGNEGPTVHEMAGDGHGYYQLSAGSARAQMDQSRQNTPLDMIGPGAGGRWF